MLSKIISFNRRRVGETQRFLYLDYLTKSAIEKDSDSYQNLIEEQKEDSDSLLHFIIKGKTGKKGVPIMIYKEDAKIIDEVILPHRDEANIESSNIYLFARRGQILNDCDSMREIAYACGAISRATDWYKTEETPSYNRWDTEFIRVTKRHGMPVHGT